MPRAGIQSTFSTGPFPACTRDVQLSAHTAAEAGASARTQNALRPIQRTSAGATTAAAR